MIKKSKDRIYNISKKYGRTLGLDLTYLVKNSFWLGMRQIFAVVASLLISIAFARLATQEIFGQYQFILTVLSIVSLLSIPGLNSSILQSAARGFDGDYKKVVKTSFLWSLLGIPVLLVIGGYYFFVGDHVFGMAFMLSSVFFPFFYAPNTWDSFLQGKDRFDISAKYSSIQAGINTLATVAMIFFSRNNLLPILLVYLISYTFFNGYYYFKSLKFIENDRHDPEIFTFGFFLTKINLLGTIATNIDRLIVGILLGPVNLAIYSIASMLAVKSKDFLKMFVAVILPKMSRLEMGLCEFSRIHRKKLVFLFLFQFAIALAFYLLVPIANLILFSKTYAAYSGLSQAFSITVFFSIPLAFLGYYIQARKNTFALIITNPVFYSIRILLNLVLIWKFHLIGAVYAFNISTVVWFLFSLFGILYEEDAGRQKT